MYITQGSGADKIDCVFEGEVLNSPLSKRGFDKKELVSGKIIKSWKDVYRDITVTVNEMNSKNYNNIEIMFSRPLACEIYSDNGDVSYMTFKSETLNLTKNKEFGTERIYYTGSIDFEE